MASEATHTLEEADALLQKSEMLLGVSRRVASISSIDEILEALVEMVSFELKAERATLFLNDASSGELYSRVAQGNLRREIRIPNSAGIAGHVFGTQEGLLVKDAYSSEYFDRAVDEQTGFTTESIACVPIKTFRGEIIGVVQCLNKLEGEFDEEDLEVLGAITTQAAVSLQSTQFVERMKKDREQEMQFLDMVSDITSELELGSLLQRVMKEATRMLNADRATLFLNDEKTGELFSRVAMGDGIGEIRLPNTAGIAGAVFTSGKSVNIPYAYADLTFNPAFDKQTGYFTRSILCVPVVNKEGKVIGATQALNKVGGPFTADDETRLKAFTAQVSIALENAKLFDDVQNIKKYNESMLESMSNGVITIDEDDKIVTCNASGLRIAKCKMDDVVGKQVDEFFTGKNGWVVERLKTVGETKEQVIVMDQSMEFAEELTSANVTLMPLRGVEGENLGSMVMIEDISSEKRMKSTMSRYMDPGLADQLLAGGEDILGGKNVDATVLFSDVRSFTTLSEQLGPQGIVALLNEYFTIMVECITVEEGMLDKFIGDAIMAAFGVPLSHDDDADRALRASISMIRNLNEWNKEREENGQLPVHMGIGLNSGPVVAGNIGSPKRMDYTMIGDGVNLAARLESACKQYSAQILVSEFTYAQLKGTYQIREIDLVVVKGKTKPVGVHEVLDFHSKETYPNLMEAVGYFKSGREYYNDGDWARATTAFETVQKLNPADALPQMYIDRCAALKADPPKDWDGVWVMKTK